MYKVEPVAPQDQVVEPTGGQQLPQDPGYSYNDLKQPIREIATEEPKTPEAPKEEVKEEPKPEIDAQKIAEDAAKSVLDQQEVARKEEERVKEEAKQEEPSEKEKAYLDWEKKFSAEKGRQPSYLEALTFVEDQAIKGIEEKQLAQKKIQEEEQVRVQKEQEETDKRLNAVVDDELSDLYNAGKLTKIQDPNNPSDQGVVERKSLFAKWAEVNMERRTKGLPDIISATRIAEFYWKKPNAQPPGADAPIAGNKGSGQPPSAEQEYSYQDIKKPWGFFRRGQ